MGRTVLVRVAAVGALFAAALALHHANTQAKQEQSSRAPYAQWQEAAQRQLIEPDMTVRLALAAEQARTRVGMELPPTLSADVLNDRAVAGYERIVLIPHNANPYAQYRLGIFYALREYPEQAQEMFFAATRQDPENEPIYIALMRLFSPDAEEDRGLEGVLPQLQKLPRWLQDLTIPRYYELTEDTEAAAHSAATPGADQSQGQRESGRRWPQYAGGRRHQGMTDERSALDAARKTAAAHQWSFGMRAVLLAGVLAVLLAVSAVLLLRLLWNGMFGKLKPVGAGRARTPLLVPWQLLDVAEVLVALMFGLVVLGQLGGLVARHLGQAAHNPTTQAALTAAQYLLMVLAGVAVMMRRVKASAGRKLSTLGLRTGGRLGPLVCGGIAGYSVYLLVIMVAAVLAHGSSLACLDPLQLGVRLLGHQSATSIAIYLMLLGVIGPVAEELIFRGFMYPALRRYLTPFPAVIIGAAVFASLHLSSAGVMQIAGLGIVLAILYERSRSVIPCIACHALNNVLVFCVILLLSY